MRHDPEHGVYPRGYAGATGTLAEVALVLCVAEPGEPRVGANPLPLVPAAELPGMLAISVARAFQDHKSAFHNNVRFLLDCCWPELNFEAQMRRTWITESVLCSAAKPAGRIPTAVERECVARYLSKQLDLLPNAFVITLGAKAQRRMKLAGRGPDASVVAAGLPGANMPKAKPSWRKAGAAFQRYLLTRG